MPFEDQNMLQMLALMGGGLGQALPDMLLQRGGQAGIPKVNTSTYAQGYEIRKTLRGGLAGHPQGLGGSRMGASHGGMEAMPQLGGGMDPSSIKDPSVANSALQPYGLQLPTHTNPFLFFNDRQQDGTPTWAGNHPRAAKAVEGAMIGLTSEGGNDIGQSISNVAKTVLGIPGMYRQNQANQMQAPFDQARQISALQDEDTKRQVALSQAFHNIATGQAALDKPSVHKSYIPMTVGGKTMGYNPETNGFEPTSGAPEDSPTPTRIGSPTKPPTDTGGIPKWVKTREERAAFFEYSQKGGEFDDKGQPSDKLGFNRLVTSYVGRNAAAAGAGGTGGRKTTEYDLGGMSDVQKAQHQAKEKAVSEAEQEVRRAQSAPIDPSTGTAGRTANVTKAQQALDAAKQDRQNFLNSLSRAKPTAPFKGATLHPDGRIEFPPPLEFLPPGK